MDREDTLVLVPRYPGMSRADAIRFRFGTDEVPAGLTAVLVKTATARSSDGRQNEFQLGSTSHIEFLGRTHA